MTWFELFLILWAFHGWVGITYKDIADRRGWETLSFFDPQQSNLDALTKASFIQVPFAVGLAWASGGVLKILLILICSYGLAVLAMEIFKSSIQWVWLYMYVLWLLSIPLVYLTI